jgi:hypothetical protein
MAMEIQNTKPFQYFLTAIANPIGYHDKNLLTLEKRRICEYLDILQKRAIKS